MLKIQSFLSSLLNLFLIRWYKVDANVYKIYDISAQSVIKLLHNLVFFAKDSREVE